VGALYSLSGTMAVSERALLDSLRLAIEEINAAGGLLGRPLELVVADGRSDPEIAASEAERLIETEEVSVLFACWTSACRKAVRPVVERHAHLMIYAVQYEGLEQSEHILYTGAAPNQQLIPATRWAMEHLGPRLLLVGSDYVFPRVAHLMVRDLITAQQGELLGDFYLPLGSQEVGPVIETIRTRKPDVVINTLNGDSNAALFDALTEAGLTHQPLLSLSVSENEMRAWGGQRLRRHYAAWGYFQSLDSAANRRFVDSFRARFGAERLLSDPMEAVYVGAHLWARAVAEEGDPAPRRLNSAALLRQSLSAPSGIAAVDGASRHLWRMVRIGQVDAEGQFVEVFASEHALRPRPWPGYLGRAQWIERLSAASLGWVSP